MGAPDSTLFKSVIFVIHNLLPDRVTCCLNNLLDSPEENNIIASQLKINLKSRLLECQLHPNSSEAGLAESLMFIVVIDSMVMELHGYLIFN